MSAENAVQDLGQSAPSPQKFAAFVILVALCAAAVFLLSRPDPGFRVAPVRGEVYYKGSPLAHASVTFVPAAGVSHDQRLATAITNVNGQFDIQTYAGGGMTPAGAQPGEYRVSVSKSVAPGGMSEADYRKMTEAAADELNRTGKRPAPVPRMVELLPPEYSDLGRSKLLFTVKDGETNTIRIEIP